MCHYSEMKIWLHFMFIVHEDTVLKCVYSGILMSFMFVFYFVCVFYCNHVVLYNVLVSDDKNKGDQSISHKHNTTKLNKAPVFVQQLVQANNKDNTNASLALCEGNPLVTCGFHWQRANNVENVSMSWYHHFDWRGLSWGEGPIHRGPNTSATH